MRLVVIVKEELPPKEKMDQELHHYLSFNTYLNWKDIWFWDRLRYALAVPIKMLPDMVSDSHQ